MRQQRHSAPRLVPICHRTFVRAARFHASCLSTIRRLALLYLISSPTIDTILCTAMLIDAFVLISFAKEINSSSVVLPSTKVDNSMPTPVNGNCRTSNTLLFSSVADTDIINSLLTKRILGVTSIGIFRTSILSLLINPNSDKYNTSPNKIIQGET